MSGPAVVGTGGRNETLLPQGIIISPSPFLLAVEDSNTGLVKGINRLRNNLVKSESIHNFWERGFKIIRGTTVLVNQAKKVKMVLGSSKGRDKICSIIQYSAKLVYTCNMYSNIPKIQDELK